jgi:hypothetical protein
MIFAATRNLFPTGAIRRHLMGGRHPSRPPVASDEAVACCKAFSPPLSFEKRALLEFLEGSPQFLLIIHHN